MLQIRELCQLQQTLYHAERLPQWQPEQAFDTQAKLDRRIREPLIAAGLAIWHSQPFHLRVKPD